MLKTLLTLILFIPIGNLPEAEEGKAMFTIMHEKNDGTQTIFSAVEVQHLPPTPENGGSAGVHLLCGPN